MENILLVLVISLDAFAASIAYGSKKIKIPFPSVIIINMVCTFFLTVSIFVGSQIKEFLPNSLTIFISFIILFLLGIYYLFESIVKSYLEKRSSPNKPFRLKLFDIWFVIDIYINEIKADLDDSKVLDSKEAIYLATALSLDSLTIGFGSSLGNINYLYVILLSLIAGMASVFGGLFLGKRLSQISTVNISWLAGIILIILAFLRLA